MKNNRVQGLLKFLPIALLLVACGTSSGAIATNSPMPATVTTTEIVLPSLSIILGEINVSQGITLDQGGDVDTVAASVGDPATETRSSGNNTALSVADGNAIADSFLQFNVDDSRLSNGLPTAHVRLEVDYFDVGTDSFSIQYDALPAGGSNGLFAGGGAVAKTDSQTMKTAVFNLCDANFANRNNGADFRIDDNRNGAEFISAVRLIGLPSATATVNVDDFGANPFDDQPDSDAIQAVLDTVCSGDTIVFSSAGSDPTYQGYLIDKTLFLTGMSAKHDLTFKSSDPNDHALLQATADLRGYVLQLLARTRFSNAGDVDNINFGNIDVNGGRDIRVLAETGPNWGSWLPECLSGDPFCHPGGIGFYGGYDLGDPTQNYEAHPALWSTGITVHDVVISQIEAGSAFFFSGAAGIIQNVTIDTAGEHVHSAGCAMTDDDGDTLGWSDGITLLGPGHTVMNNTIINPSDVGIVFFGGKNTVISNNTVIITPGNYGAFAGIALHPWIIGDISGFEVNGNNVSSEGDVNCGGLHAGINIGTQMWGGGCVASSYLSAYGNNGECGTENILEEVALCQGGACKIWAYLPTGATLTMRDNTITGAHINYFVEGLAMFGLFIDENNTSQAPQLSDWGAARAGCYGISSWGAFDKVAHNPSLPGYTDLAIYCER